MDFDDCPCSGKTLARLLQPAVMAVLAKGPLHGYSIGQELERLAIFKDQPPDPTGIYRTLHAMEESGLVESTWDLSDSGPAKRRFRLTGEGRQCLGKWQGTLARYTEAISELLALVRQVSE